MFREYVCFLHVVWGSEISRKAWDVVCFDAERVILWEELTPVSNVWPVHSGFDNLVLNGFANSILSRWNPFFNSSLPSWIIYNRTNTCETMWNTWFLGRVFLKWNQQKTKNANCPQSFWKVGHCWAFALWKLDVPPQAAESNPGRSFHRPRPSYIEHVYTWLVVWNMFYVPQ